jgi:transcriptional regulator with XRE-family HTH domain
MQSVRIKQWIAANNMTQQTVANRIGYWRNSVSRALAREHVSDDFWARFSEAFPEAAVELLSDQQDQPTPDEKAGRNRYVIAQTF